MLATQARPSAEGQGDTRAPDRNLRRERLRAMCEPDSIVLIGASEKSLWSKMITDNFVDLGFSGRLYAVNRGGAPVFGVPGFTSCREIGEPVALAFVMVGKGQIIDALEDLAGAGIRNAVVLTAGFAETGIEGAEDQARLVARAKALDVMIWGPNTLGFTNAASSIPASSIPIQKPHLLPAIAIVSQSGATASELHDYAHSQNIGSSFVAAMGNQADITLSDVVDFLVDHEPTRAIALFVEGIVDPAAFVAAAIRARGAGKPLVMLKIGRTELAGAVAQAHTGALLSSDAVFNAVCERLGVVLVDTIEDLINVAGLLAAIGRIEKPGLSFLSISGGSCTLVADGSEKYGVELPQNDETTRKAMRAVLPDIASTLNPLDVTGIAITDPDIFERIIPLVAGAPDIGLVAISMTLPSFEGHGVPAALDAIGRGVSKIDKPAILVTPATKAFNDVSRAAVIQHRLPHVITGIDAMLRAVAKAHWWSEISGSGQACLARSRDLEAPAIRPRSEREALDYLASFGVPVVPARIVNSAKEAGVFAGELGGMLALKIASPDIAHKTEVGGVCLGVRPEFAAATFDAIIENVGKARPDARLDGVIISPMRSAEGVELLVSVINDPAWGPAITIGFGGVLVEVLADAIIAPLPVTAAYVIGMLRRLKGARLLRGFRGMPPADEAAIANAIVNIGNAALSLGPTLASLEINPLRVSGAEVEALDALVLWEHEASDD